MPKLTQQTTKRQEKSLRQKMQMRAAALTNRILDNAEGKLTDKTGNPIEMTPGQIKSAEMILSRCVPTLTSATYEEVIPDRTIDDIESELEELRKDTDQVKGIRLVR